MPSIPLVHSTAVTPTGALISSNVVHHRAVHTTERSTPPNGPLFLGITTFNFDREYFLQLIMSVIDKEARIILAIEAIRSSKKICLSKASVIYKVSKTTLRERMNGRAPRSERQPNCQNMVSEGTKPVPDVTKQAWPCGIVYLCP